MVDILNLDKPQLDAFVTGLGQPRFRADQVWQWLWAKRCRTYEEMTNLSKDLRSRLAEESEIRWPELAKTAVSQDGTVKFLLGLADGALVETVLIPEPDHLTACLSTQVGCAMGCAFCSTGQMGFSRNMTMGEILGQLLVARQWLADQDEPDREPERLRNVVFMGMGDPLLNLDELLRALKSMTSETGLHFSTRRITVSSVGFPDKLARLGESGLASLAISLHAPTQELREQIMPGAARATHMDDLLAALDAYPLKNRQRITIEYVLLGGVNDSDAHAKKLAGLFGFRKAKVNLIAYNAAPDAPFSAPEKGRIAAFQQILRDKGVSATLRKSKGQDISAACGQLKTEYMNKQC